MVGKRARPIANLKLEAFCFGYEHKDENLKEIKFPKEYRNDLLAAALIGYSFDNGVKRVYKGDKKTIRRQGWIRCDGCGMKLQFKKDLFHVSGIQTNSGEKASSIDAAHVTCSLPDDEPLVVSAFKKYKQGITESSAVTGVYGRGPTILVDSRISQP